MNPPRARRSDRLLERLLALHPKVIDLSLSRIEALLADLDHPEQRLPPVIHIAGTNGKGSTAAMLRAGLEATGGRVHAYHSPHLVRFHERIIVAGRRIREDALTRLLDRCERVNRGRPITFFEITTAAALLAHAERAAEYCVLEVGLGGRLDATNVVPRPRLTAITRVGLDHQSWLGDSLTEIAGEKAGILKPGVPAVIGRQQPAALDAITAIAKARGAELFREGIEWTCRARGEGMVYEDGDGRLDLPRPALAGRHQIENAGIALAALRRLGLPTAGESVAAAPARAAVAARNWPARLQPIRNGPLRSTLPQRAELILDGGHNADAGRVLADELRRRTEADGRPPFLIAGMLDSKDATAFFAPFRSTGARAFAVPIAGHAAIPPAALAAAANLAGVPCGAVESPLAAARQIRRESPDCPRVLLCGSLHLAGEVLRTHR